MPLTTTEFTVKLGRTKLWSLLNDLSTLGKCVPGCESVSILGPEDSRWTVKLAVGIISRRIEAKAHVRERLEPERLSLGIESSDGDITGCWNLELAEEGPDSTRIKLTADMSAKGAFEWVVNQVIKTQMNKLVSQFADCISGRAT